MSDLSVYALTPVGTIPLHTLAPVSKVGFSTTFGAATGGSGLDSLTFSMSIPDGFSSWALIQGSMLELRMGSGSLGRAVLTTIDPETGAVTTTPLRKRGADFIAVEDMTTLAGTINPATAITNALGMGLEWQVDTGVLAALDKELASTNTVSNVDPTTWYTISDLLDAYCAQTGSDVHWGLDAQGFLRIFNDPKTPTYMLAPSVPAMDSTSTDYVTDLIVKYSDITKPVGDGSTFYASALKVNVAVPVGASRRVATDDITPQGPLTLEQARESAQADLAAKAPTMVYNGGVDVRYGDVQTFAGYPIPGWRVVAEAALGLMVAHQGWRNMAGALMPGFAQDWIIGQATYSDAGAVSLTPVANALRTPGQTIASTVEQVTSIGKKADLAIAIAQGRLVTNPANFVIPGTSIRVQSGSVSYGTLAAGATVTLAVTFPTALSAAPLPGSISVVPYASQSAARFLVALSTVPTASSMTVTVTNVSAGAATLAINWRVEGKA